MLTTEVTKAQEKRNVKLLALNGLGFGPSFLWVDENHQLFALAYSWMGLTPEGWGNSLKKLQALQDKAEFEFNKQLATKNSIALNGVTVINNVDIFTAKDNQLIKNTSIAIENGKILAIGKKVKSIKADKVIDGKGRTLMPGLWDMHAHIQMGDGLLNIANGVTSVRDLANDHAQLMQTIEVFNSGEVIGPSIYRGGFIDQKSPFSAPTGKLAETLEEALKYVDWYAERGYQQIKIYSSITPEWVKPIAERVHQHGMRLSGHIPSYMTAEKAVKDGFDEIQHINMVFLNFLAGPKDDTRTPVRFKLVAEEAGSLDLNSKAVNDFIELLKKRKTVVDPTVTIFHSMFLNKAGELDPGYAMIADHLPANVARGFLAAEMEITADNEQRYADSANALLMMIKKLYDAGVPLVAGTDAIVGFTLHRELELYAKAGIPNYDVLKIATINSARIAGQKDVGTIEEGMIADLILLDGNPLEDISHIRSVAMTIKGNNLYRSDQLFESIGIKPFVRF
ncbi:amidohydrolase family protein [Aliikangiella marina]|uniref:Amidohydrolase family protein n=1 Tax=Aliikangiella marina TaxID=1712262 RepID=A0A545TC97_9GAMM|nr:amidohydrolase family protein [Aliikangiella marina]TQV74843.1 amidohydrolase family protein [Aliikangiella marina]